jgi:RNA polymerase sigma factor (sigma-70 family)
MARPPLNAVLQHLRKMAAANGNRELTDSELMECFVRSRDDAAFTVLIERHGPMVFGVCARLLSNRQDAEDACQATFLVLARKAASIRKKRSLGSWLHGVARRIAIDLKRGYARRVARERAAETIVPKDPAAEVSWREVQTLLDDELQRLPDRYRTPLILCYLECLTRDEAAKRLGVSSSALHGRLERARQRLRDGLVKRGLTLAAALSAAALGETAAHAALTPTFVVSSTRAAVAFTGNSPLAPGVVAPRVLVLTREVMKRMFRTKATCVTAVVLCAGLLVALVGDFLTSLSFAQEAGAKASKNAAPTAKGESDEEFIRRISKDLRGVEPTPTEIHFFVHSKDSARRNRLIDLFIQERQERQAKARQEEKVAAIYRNITVGESNARRAQAEQLAKQVAAIEVRSRVSGYLMDLAVKPGEVVKSGDVLFRIEAEPFQAKLESAQVMVDQARVNVSAAEAKRKRSQELAEKKEEIIAVAELVLKAEEEQAKAMLRLAEAKRNMAVLNLELAIVRAPADGRIAAIHVTQGTLVTANQTVVLTLGVAKAAPRPPSNPGVSPDSPK